jgi:hypothetical protein
MHRNLGDLSDKDAFLILRFLSAIEETLDDRDHVPG